MLSEKDLQHLSNVMLGAVKWTKWPVKLGSDHICMPGEVEVRGAGGRAAPRTKTEWRTARQTVAIHDVCAMVDLTAASRQGDMVLDGVRGVDA